MNKRYPKKNIYIYLQRGKPGRPPHSCFTSPKAVVVSYDLCTSARMSTDALFRNTRVVSRPHTGYKTL